MKHPNDFVFLEDFYVGSENKYLKSIILFNKQLN